MTLTLGISLVAFGYLLKWQGRTVLRALIWRYRPTTFDPLYKDRPTWADAWDKAKR